MSTRAENPLDPIAGFKTSLGGFHEQSAML
jgi:hypothetical protein